MDRDNIIDIKRSDIGFRLEPHYEEKLIQLVQAKLGLVIQDHQLSTLSEVALSVYKSSSMSSWDEFIDGLWQETEMTNALEDFIAGVTVGESYFFRDEDHIEYLRTICLPQLIKSKREKGDLHLRI